ncbi:DNA mismatch repair protein MutS [Thermodesulfitimonas autotrophica]|uniref:DNA mismatch repair protein MutS n=1 Tax=Thermodesulfitimonas autotrophica TaxID=1894989 RepID=A0A3N5ACQ7_9THEO|nr:DNA mismatch repair protein MutS [Thermodesulfitimonas autotrophica]RPF42666.1 DNA mismatch repair protein MutS [Thermodesulfitimonas autotrophica]
MSLTPMMQQYMEIKKEYPDAILFFHLGDFYEMFFEDAERAAPVLEVALTSRDAGKLGRVPMCGVPCHSAAGYIARLVGRGFKVAICEQLEDPAQAKGLVRRGVTRVITPGTFFEGQPEDQAQSTYVVSVAPVGKTAFGLAVADVGTGDFRVTEFAGPAAKSELYDEIYRLQPVEAVLPEGEKELAGLARAAAPAAVTFYPADFFAPHRAREALRAFRAAGEWLGAEGAGHEAAVAAAGALAAYLQETQKRELVHLQTISFYTPDGFMLLDAATRRNLELTRSLQDGGRKGTLLEVLDYTLTGMGGRRLREWLEQPLLSPQAIEARLAAVAPLVADEGLREAVRAGLKKIGDLERLAGKLAYGMANARDLLSLKEALRAAAGLRELLGAAAGLLGQIRERLADLGDVVALIERAIAPEPPAVLNEGGLIREGYDETVDRLRAVRRDARSFIAALEAKERERTGIKSLKVGYNRVFGYYIEVTKANLALVPPDYQRRQTLATAERFITPELKEYEEMALGAEEKLNQREYELFCAVREAAAGAIDRILRTARALGELDALQSLAVAAVRGNYVRPQVNEGGAIIIREGRHPVVERFLGPGGFVPNDTHLDDAGRRIAIITGPNMAGKSTYMRQVALIVLLAQVGSFVPAAEATIGVVDRIFTRIGAADNLAGGQSTFMMEMSECRTILTGATRRSLVIMDEVGRGTSTYDGMSIARAIIEYLATRIGAKTLFSTHYHELTDLDRLSGVFNLTVAVREDASGVAFLYRVVPGKADKSYGIQVAALAGLPAPVLARAREILTALEARAGGSRRVVQLEIFPQPEGHPVVERLAALDTDNLTPLQALNILAELKDAVAAVKSSRRGRRGGR